MAKYKKVNLKDLRFQKFTFTEVVYHISLRRRIEIKVYNWINQLDRGDRSNLSNIQKFLSDVHWEKFEISEEFENTYPEICELINEQDSDLLSMISDLRELA